MQISNCKLYVQHEGLINTVLATSPRCRNTVLVEKIVNTYKATMLTFFYGRRQNSL